MKIPTYIAHQSCFQNLLNKKFGSLMVVEFLKPGSDGRGADWQCQCDCGELRTVKAAVLKNGTVVSCHKCGKQRYSQKRSKDMTGKRFGKLLVMTRDGKNRRRCATWICQCDCGKTCSVTGWKLRRGYRKSCGCINNKEIGHKFTRTGGYVMLKTETGYVYEHKHIMEQKLGRSLFSDENVHHINGVRSDNRLENLELWSKSHPTGQRVEDKVRWAKEILARYETQATFANGSSR